MERLAILVLLATAAPVGGAGAQVERSVAVAEAERSRLGGDWAAAAEAARRLLAAQPDDLAAAEVLVHALLDGGRWSAALEEASRVERPASEAPRAAALLGEALFRAGRLEQVEATLGPLAAAPQAPARAWMTLGRLRKAQGREREAVDLMQRAVAGNPEDRDVLYRAAEAAGGRAEAIELLERYLARSAGDDEESIAAAKGQVALLRALGQRPVWTSRSSPDSFDLPLKPLWVAETGEVVGYTVQVRLGSGRRPVSLLLDSGSPGLFVIERIARRHGFDPLATLTLFGGGGEGQLAAQRGFFSELGIGALAYGDVLASVGRQELDPEGRYHGLIGLAALSGYRVTVDLARRRLHATREGAPQAGDTYYEIAGQMLVRAHAGQGRDGLFLLDTGSTHTLVAESFAADLPGVRLGAPVEIFAPGGLRRGARSLSGLEITLGGSATGRRELRAADLSLRSQVAGVEVSGFVGLDLLEGKVIEIDPGSRTVAVGAPVSDRSPELPRSAPARPGEPAPGAGGGS